MNNSLLTIVDMVPINNGDIHPHNIDGINRPYSLVPGQYYEGTHYITYLKRGKMLYV